MERENEGVCEEEGVKTGKLESIRSLSTKRVKRLPAGRGCTQLLPQCMARRSSGSRLPACPPAAAPPQVAAPSWVLKQQKCDGLLSHSSSLSYRNVVSALCSLLMVKKQNKQLEEERGTGETRTVTGERR